MNLFDAPYSAVREYDSLPANLSEAIKAAEQSDFVRASLPEKTIDAYLNAKRAEWSRYADSSNKSQITDSLYFYRY